MPMAIPLLAAAGSISAGIAAGGIIGGMMIAGGAMTAIGTLAKDKSLVKWGGLLSLAGGVAGLATGAWSTAAETLASESSSLAGGFGEAGLAEGALSSVAEGGLMGNPLTNPGAFTGGEGMLTSAGGAPVEAMLSAGQGYAVPTGAMSAQAPAAIPTPQAPNVAQAPAIKPVDTTGGALQPAVDFAKANPRLVQAGTGLLSAGMNYYGAQDAAKESMRLQEEAQQRARDRMNASVAGVRVPTYQRKG